MVSSACPCAFGLWALVGTARPADNQGMATARLGPLLWTVLFAGACGATAPEVITTTSSPPPVTTATVPVTTCPTTTSTTTTTTAPTTTTPPSTTGPPTVEAARLIWEGDTDEKIVALTFDAGSDQGYATEILDLLALRGIKASFGMTGCWAE